MNVTRRRIIHLGGAALAASLSPRLASPQSPVPKVTGALKLAGFQQAPSPFPHLGAPRIIGVGPTQAVLCPTGEQTVLIHNGRRVPLGHLTGVRAVADSGGKIHIAGLHRGELCYITTGPDLRPESRTIAKIAAHASAGLAIADTPAGVRIVAPGPQPRTLAVYTTGGARPLVLAEWRWFFPLLAYDAKNALLHLAFAPWNDWSSMYDVVYSMQSPDDGRTWTTSNGTAHQLPLRPVPFEHGEGSREPEAVSVRGQPAGPESNTLPHDLVLDSRGNPHLLYSFCRPYWIAAGPTMDPPGEPRVRTKHARLADGRWTTSDLCPDFTFDVYGGSLSFDDAGALHAVVSCKRQPEDWMDLAHLISRDQGRTWTKPEFITSTATNQRAHHLSPATSRAGNELHVAVTVASAGVSAVHSLTLRL